MFNIFNSRPFWHTTKETRGRGLFSVSDKCPGGNNPILTNAQPPGEHAAANARPWGQISVQMPHTVPGGWSQMELTDSLVTRPSIVFIHIYIKMLTYILGLA